jgi:hypothetical protein
MKLKVPSIIWAIIGFFWYVVNEYDKAHFCVLAAILFATLDGK